MQPLKAPRSHASYKEEIDRLKSEVERLHQAHREWWEQAKREMAQEVDMEGGIKYKPGSREQQALYKAANRIRAMEYKGAEKTV